MADPIRQLLSQTSYVADGVSTVWNFAFSGGYLDKSHVKAKYLDAAHVEHQIAVTPGMFLGQYQLNITPPIAAGSELVIYRDTPKEGPLVDFIDAASLTEASLDMSAKQGVFVAAESSDLLVTTIASTDQLQAKLVQAEAARAGAAVAEAGAASQASASAASAAESLGYLQAYRSTSYGALSADPVTDPLGNPPTIGDEYFNTSANLLKRWNGATWQASDISTANLAASGGSALTGYLHSAGVDGTTVQAAARAELANVNLYFIAGEASSNAMFARAVAAARRVFAPAGNYSLTAQLSIPSDTEIYGAGDATNIQILSGAYTGFFGSGSSGVKINNLKLSYPNSVAPTAYKGAIVASNCSRWEVDRVTIDNPAYWGICLWNTSDSAVTRCSVFGGFSTNQDSANIALRSASNRNRIKSNNCHGPAADHGILMQDPYDSTTPTGNLIEGNYISEKKAYGIAAYVTTDYDTKTIIRGNFVYDILGTALAGASGAGIYIQRAGGTIVMGNQVWNCTRQSTNFTTLAMGHIGVSSGGVTAWPVVVSMNIISSTRGAGVAVLTTVGAVTVTNNAITVVNSVVGEYGHCINASNCSRLKITGNTLKHTSTTHIAVKITAINQLVTDLDISGNEIDAPYIGIYMSVIGTGRYEDVKLVGNMVKGGSSSALFISKGTDFTIVGNTLKSSGVAYSQENVTHARLSTNTMASTSDGVAFIFTGVNTGTIVDESNRMSGGLINNAAGNGTIISRYAASAPGQSGTHGVGDRVIQSVPVVGNPKGWRCTVGGNPGTWASEGVL